MPSAIGIRTNIRPCPPRSPNCHVSPELSSLCYVSLLTLLLSLSIYIYHFTTLPMPSVPPKPACKPYSIIFPRLCPVTPSHHIHLHIVQHLTFSYLGSISHDVIFSNLRHSVDLCKLSTSKLFLRTSYTSTRCLFMFGEHNKMKSKL